MKASFQTLLSLLVLSILLLAPLHGEQQILRVGFFPNITHAHGIIGSTQPSPDEKAWFEQRLGPDVTIQWFVYNAGPSAMEAIFAGSLDLTYVGPNPALNAYIRSKGRQIRILSGATIGGAALILRKDLEIATPENFRGLRIGTPQLGNTQDVAARAWLVKQGFNITLSGGDASVLPTANPDQLNLLQSSRLDAVWTVEPWVSRLELEAGGHAYLEQTDAITTVLVASTKILATNPALVRKFLAAHRELTTWINANPEQAKELIRLGLTERTHRPFEPSLINNAWKRLRFSDELSNEAFNQLIADAQSVGFLRNAIPLDRLFLSQP